MEACLNETTAHRYNRYIGTNRFTNYETDSEEIESEGKKICFLGVSLTLPIKQKS